ncbi:hypothetical protein RCF27_01225 [Rhodococcus pyridinivorans]|uniref:hypothetical protein n=1 Tax=Rhodococcus pyridinivorans TaxID=103816 RepID=UPI00280B1299|nr:hypothetical protein [Rhodococcus pyridinivorans]WMM73005.1 hypothetical protein RCF27_01225 [Rhodococcus pyridinivorans]
MAGYFGDEPTCQRCDYPRRLHHLLGVEHDYTERPEENAPDAGQGIEGNESTNQEAGDSAMQSTDPQSYMVRLIVAGLQQIIAHADTFRSAIALINADVTRRFGWDEIEHSVTTGDYVRLTTTVGLEVEYRIIPHDQPVPEDEPAADTIDDAPEGILVDPIPTVYQNLETLGSDADWGDGDNFLLAEVTRGVFTAQVWRHDSIERGRPHSEVEITIDSTGMQGGEMFHDLCILPDQLEDFQQVTNAIMTAYQYIAEAGQ